MKVKFNDGTVKNCTTPTEQKVFKQGVGAGWVLIFALICDMTSTEVDELISTENISGLSFITEDENGLESTIFISDYDKISSAIIRYSDEKDKTRVEIQLTKGV